MTAHVLPAATSPAELVETGSRLAALAGSGLGVVLPSRGADVVKLAILRRRMEGSRLTTLAATLLPETLFEWCMGAALIFWALHAGVLPVHPLEGGVHAYAAHPWLLVAGLAGAVALAVAAVRVLGPRARAVAARLRQGLAILGRPRDFILHVVPWQAAGRV